MLAAPDCTLDAWLLTRATPAETRVPPRAVAWLFHTAPPALLGARTSCTCRVIALIHTCTPPVLGPAASPKSWRLLQHAWPMECRGSARTGGATGGSRADRPLAAHNTRRHLSHPPRHMHLNLVPPHHSVAYALGTGGGCASPRWWAGLSPFCAARNDTQQTRNLRQLLDAVAVCAYATGGR